jgi:hypothetical protein
MGVDFITSCAQTFEKSWDRGRKELADPSLFTDIPAEQRQTFVVNPRPGCVISAGRWYEVAVNQGKAVLLDGIEIVGDFAQLPEFAIQQLTETGCEAAAAYSHSVHELSGAANVTLR